MSNVVSLEDARLEKQPHNVGNAKCLACSYTYIAVMPAGLSSAVCPECGAGKVVYTEFVEGKVNYQCRCGSVLFVMCTQYNGHPLCAVCGSLYDMNDIVLGPCEEVKTEL